MDNAAAERRDRPRRRRRVVAIRGRHQVVGLPGVADPPLDPVPPVRVSEADTHGIAFSRSRVERIFRVYVFILYF